MDDKSFSIEGDLLVETWGYLNSGIHDAATNMAIDEALLIWHSEGKVPPVIRFYGWRKPSLSIGRFQNAEKTVDFPNVAKNGCEFVRRLTGGSAVLHDHELTYSIIVKESHDLIPHSVNDAYQVLSQGLLLGYRSLGIEASFAKPRKNGNRSAVCFETPAIYEILVDGKKISGNAQTRKNGVLLQHGSLPIEFNVHLLFELFQFSNDGKRVRQREKFKDKAIGINDIVDEPQSFETLIPVFLHAFQKSLSVKVREFQLSSEQWAFIEYLKETKYESNEWNKYQNHLSKDVKS